MIRFFRKIRQRLLTEGRFSKYLLYAIGEIALVVIGILLALGINNWRESQIVQEREQFYLEGLQTEFENNKIKLQNLIEVNRLNYENSQKLAGLIENRELAISEKELSQMLYNSFSYGLSYNPNNSLLNDLLNSGRLGDISNTELRKHLTAWESFIQSTRIQEDALKLERAKIVDLFRGNDASIRTILDQTDVSTGEMGLKKVNKDFSNFEIVKSRDFENNLMIFILTGIATEKSQYEPLMREIETILSLISAEIKS